MKDVELPTLGCVIGHRFVWCEIIYNPGAPAALRAAACWRYAMITLRAQAKWRYP